VTSRLIAFPGRRWLAARSLTDSAVHRINVGRFYEVGAALRAVTNIPLGSGAEGDVPVLLTAAKNALAVLLGSDVPLALTVSRDVAEDLNAAIDSALLPLESPDQVENVASVRKLAIQLEIILVEELNKQAIYHVFPKRAYDINILIQDATKVFSDDIRKALSQEATRDVAAAGRCLAFELPTAAVFHLMRGLEATIWDYYSVVVGAMPKKKLRNWGTYIKLLEKHGAAGTVVSVLTQIKDLHRNPVLHPELFLEMDEALSLLGIVESAIGAMFADMHKRGAQLGNYEKTRMISLPPNRMFTRQSGRHDDG